MKEMGFALTRAGPDYRVITFSISFSDSDPRQHSWLRFSAKNMPLA